MTREFTILLVILGGGVLLVASGVYWWISRTPTVERTDNGLPLFGELEKGEPVPQGPMVDERADLGRMVEGHALRFSVPVDGLPLLPGRLEVGTGLDAGREIRFVNVEGPNGIEVTFGRVEGPLYTHVQLRDKTVSRSHARLHFDDGTWYLESLSETNPVVHNGQEMLAWVSCPLADGDHLEMGEVHFTFRER